ncbi:MAG: hypothetical protein ACRDU8_05280, partial [Egibacteraceae bacterium]
MRRVTTLLTAVLLTALWVAPAAAQYPPEEDAEAFVSDTTVAPGEEVTVTGEDFTPGSTVSVSLDGAVLGSATVA